MRFQYGGLMLVASLLLGGCGVADRPAGLEDGAPTALAAYPVLPVAVQDPAETTQPLPNLPESEQTAAALAAEPWLANPTWQANLALRTAKAIRRERLEQTARAMGPPPTQVIGTPDWRPTLVPSNFEKIPGGGYLIPSINFPSRHPTLNNGWSLDLPDGRQLNVYAGGYIFPIDKPYKESLKPEQGAFSVGVELYKPPTKLNSELDHSDPRNTAVTLPVRDGMARVVDALVTDDRIMVMLRTDGGSAYTYEVNSGTLASAQPPTADAGGPYTMRAGNLLDITAQGHDAAGTLFDCVWDLDGDGSFEAKGQRVTFSAKNLSAPQDRVVRVQVTAKSGLSAIAETTISITN